MSVVEKPNQKIPQERFIAEAWKNLELIYGIPSIVSADIKHTPINHIFQIDFTTKQLDFVRELPKRCSHSATVNLNPTANTTFISNSDPIDLTNVAASIHHFDPTSNLKKKAILRLDSNNSVKKRFVEVWHGSWLAKSWEVTDKHGDFYTDDTFGGLQWSPTGRYIVYTAEPKEPEGFEPRGYTKDANNRPLAGLANPKKYDFNEDFGESYNSRKPPVLILVDVVDESVNQISGQLTDNSCITPAQPTWVIDSNNVEKVVFTGYKSNSRHMGMVYMENRPSDIYICDIDGNNLEPLTDGSSSVRSPCPTPDTKSVVYLSSYIGGAHNGTSRLCQVNIESKINTEIVPIIQKPSSQPSDFYPPNFPGLYVFDLPKNPWTYVDPNSPNNLTIFCNSIWESSDVILAIEIATKKVHRLSFPSGNFGSMKFLSSSNNTILASYSTPSKAPELVAASIHVTGDINGSKIDVLEWKDLDLVSKDAEGSGLIRDTIDWSIIDYPEKTKNLQTILIKPKQNVICDNPFLGGKLPPLAFFTHGGPHVTITASVNPYATFLALLGFVVAQVNYTGSLGFGQHSVDSLISNIGKLEVEEMIYVTNDLAQNKKIVDPNRMVYCGGSHSGYTGAHIAGRYPGLFKAFALRNPVINIGEMVPRTDIPDWCFCELGFKYNFDMDLSNPDPLLLTPEMYKVMWDASPQQYVANVQDPIILTIGLDDRRVPPEQGFQYYRLLKANKKPVVCKAYPKTGHPLDSVEAIRENLMTTVIFFYEHMGFK
ncbi:hypothetical protein BB561_006677 [Smittium simulii]|uniref:Acylamino-acid-releasing enzyme n=1 Tax=Smittium simulii TaxID=133385 RepID=A0A2T9Y2G5_9FUNG|nr:hypothetical protein BB561_006677 [Smittium simulii]